MVTAQDTPDTPDIDLPGDRFDFEFYGPDDFLDDMRGLLDRANEQIENILSSERNISAESWTDYLYGEALGLAGQLSLTIVLILTFLLVIPRRATGRRFVSALYALLFIVVFGPVWFAMWDTLYDFGTRLTVAVGGLFEPRDVELSSMLDVDTWLGSVLSYFFSLAPAGVLLIIVTIYGSIILMGTKLFGIIGISLYGLEWARRFVRFWLALGLTATVAGRPIAMFFIELGYLLQEVALFGDSLLGTIIYIGAGYTTAIISQVVLVFVIYSAVKKVEGYVRSHGLIRGTVRTIQERKIKVDVDKVKQIQQNSLTVKAARGVKNTGAEVGSAVKKAAIAAAAAKGIQMVSKTNVYTATAGYVMSKAARMRRSKTSPRR